MITNRRGKTGSPRQVQYLMRQSVSRSRHGVEPPPLFLSLSFTGMVIRPKADETFEIVYTIQKTESWDMYAQALDKFLGRKFGLIVALTSVEHLVLFSESFFYPVDDSFTVPE